MKSGTIVAIAAAASTLPLSYAIFHHTQCAPLTDGARARLVSYVQKKYNVAAESGLQISDASLVGSTCYRKLEFKSQGSPRPFHVSLFATPDLKYLTKELLDVGGTPTP